MQTLMACLVGLMLSSAAWAEPVVEGQVRLSSGEPAVGARVLVFDLADLSRYVGATTDEAGQFVLSLGALASGQALPEGFELGQNYPNPFNPTTMIPYELAAAGYVRLEVFNLLGQRVVTLVDGEQAAGRYTAQWDARNAAGQGVAAGVYIYRLLAGGNAATRRMVLVDGPSFDRLSPRGAAGGGVGVRPVVSAGAADYGLTVSGVGLETYVDADFRVGAGPVEVVVALADELARGKVAAGRILGDVNNDGTVDLNDALLVTLYSGDLVTAMPNNGDISLGDVNGDGQVDSADAYLIALYNADPTYPGLPAGIGEPEEPVDGGSAVGAERTFSLPGGAELEMVWIEPGVFQMGAPESEINEFIDWCVDLGESRSTCVGAFGHLGPLHEVEISKGFYLGKYEITQGQWEAVMGTTPWAGEWNVRENSSHPAVEISWDDVQTFIGRLNAAASDSLYRLPTEAEWEYACRAGTSTRWSFGDDERELTHYAWYSANAWDVGERYAHAVGTKLPNAWGLYDMHGNVWEWVQDWYGAAYYNSSPRIDPPGPSSGSYRVLRGGAFSGDTQLFLRSAFRNGVLPDRGGYGAGVRLVRIGRPGEVPIDPPEEALPVEEPEEPPIGGGGAVGEERTFSLPGGAEMEFVWIGPGVFQMGATESDREYPFEGPLHEVEISTGFYLGQYEVTLGQWEAVMGTPPWAGRDFVQEHSSLPAVYISWYDTQWFIGRLNAAAGDSLYRLPSEAEWEYACRAGTQTRWSFGDDESQLTDYAWYEDNASGVNEVGLKRPNGWGLYDMHGNVLEWVQDWFDPDYYASSPRVDPLGPSSGSWRVFRGGAFFHRAEFVRSAFRYRGRATRPTIARSILVCAL